MICDVGQTENPNTTIEYPVFNLKIMKIINSNISIIKFTIPHGVISGKQIKTVHNCLICTSELYSDGNLVYRWKVLNPFHDILQLNTGKNVVIIRYRFFPWISIKILADKMEISNSIYWTQTVKLYLSLPIVLMPIFILYLILHFLKY